MSEFEWILRCQRQFAKRTDDYSHNWEHYAETCYEEMHEDFEDDPEAAADEDISYWD